MEQIGKIDSVCRYPVKGMRGEDLSEVFLSYSGVYGDRVYGFRTPAAPAGFPYHTAREHEDLLLYQPRYRYPEKTMRPPNLAEAEAMAPGITPVHGDRDQFAIDVTTPEGVLVPLENASFASEFKKARDDNAPVYLVYSETALTDCRPVSLISLQTVGALQDEIGAKVDRRQFRANIYMDLENAGGFAENNYVGKTIKIGDKAVIAFLERDPRCKMIALDPDTGDHNPKVLQHLTEKHEGRCGIYAAVLVEGVVKVGDPISVLS
jgi:uncharacterized protein YcbX